MCASVPRRGIISLVGIPGALNEDPTPTVAGEEVATVNICPPALRIWINTERLAVSKPTVRTMNTARFIYRPYPLPVLGKPGVGVTGGMTVPASTFTAHVSETPPLVTVMVLRPVDA